MIKLSKTITYKLDDTLNILHNKLDTRISVNMNFEVSDKLFVKLYGNDRLKTELVLL